VEPNIGSPFLPTPPAFDAPVRGGVPSEYRHVVSCRIKLEWCSYPVVKKNFEDSITRFDRMYKRDGRTDTA